MHPDEPKAPLDGIATGDGPGELKSRETAEPLMTIREAAEAFGVKYWVVARAAKKGEIPTYRIGTGRRRVRRSDIEAAIQDSRSVAE
jgi:excisionase family DNA binding protein